MRSYPNTIEYLPEVQEEYWRAINSIIIKKHLRESRHDIVPCDLIVVFGKKNNAAPDFGLIPVKRDTCLVIEEGIRRVEKGVSFYENFQTHCEVSLRTKKNVIVSLQLIKSECDKLMQTDLFRISSEKRDPLRL